MSTTASDTAGDIAKELVNAMPAPTTQADTAPPPPPSIPEPAIGSTGKVELNSKGKVKGKPGRPPKARSAAAAVDAAAAQTATPATAPPLDPAAKEELFRQTSIMCTALWEGTGRIVFGEDGAWQSKEECEGVRSAIEGTLRYYDVADIPPAWLLAFVAVSYAGARIHKPSSRERIALGWSWLRRKVGL